MANTLMSLKKKKKKEKKTTLRENVCNTMG